jgi:hypothetical protein
VTYDQWAIEEIEREDAMGRVRLHLIKISSFVEVPTKRIVLLAQVDPDQSSAYCDDRAGRELT